MKNGEIVVSEEDGDIADLEDGEVVEMEDGAFLSLKF